MPVSDAKTSLWKSMGRARYAVLILTLLGLAALVPGLVLPVLFMKKLMSQDTYSVLTGIWNLADGGNYILALIVFAFSVLFPIAKLLTLIVILFRKLTDQKRMKVLRWLMLLGRWSMLDVFVIAVLAGSVKLGMLAENQSRPGIYVFAAAIFLSMLATTVLEKSVYPELEKPEHAALQIRSRFGALLSLVACGLAVVGMWIPLMLVEKWLFWDSEYGVIQGAQKLSEGGELPLAIAVYGLVAALPLLRFLLLTWIQWRGGCDRLAHFVLNLEKWAMLDVFGLGLLIVTAKIGDVATVTPIGGFWFLFAAVVLSMCVSWMRRSRRLLAA